MPDQIEKLQTTQRGRDILRDELKWREALRASDDNISKITSKVRDAATEVEKQKLKDDWAAEVNKQTGINKKLNDLGKEAAGILLVTHH